MVVVELIEFLWKQKKARGSGIWPKKRKMCCRLHQNCSRISVWDVPHLIVDSCTLVRKIMHFKMLPIFIHGVLKTFLWRGQKTQQFEMLHNLTCKIKRSVRFHSYCLHKQKRVDIIHWLAEVWEQFPTKIVNNAFTGSGCVSENWTDYSGATDSETDGC